MRDLMRDFVACQKADRGYDLWFRTEVEQGLRELNDPDVRLIPHEEVSKKWELWRAELGRRTNS